ncbi:MAG: phosphate signaling complex protein PhoU [Gammaproteobacteria bacterium]|nr:phosphate signaling complex protein PhoU [Gammaproteobacteria bacterium]
MSNTDKPTPRLGQGHTVHRYDQGIKQLRSIILDLGNNARKELKLVSEALIQCDSNKAHEVVTQVNSLRNLILQADEDCMELIAMHNPMAGDLRLIMALSKCICEFERISNQANKIAKIAVKSIKASQPSQGNSKALSYDVSRISELAMHMLDLSLQILENESVELAVDLVQSDDAIDELFAAAIRHLSTYIMEDPRNIGQVIETVLVLKAFEKIGDHAANVGERVIFAVTGKDVSFLNSEQLGQGLLDP